MDDVRTSRARNRHLFQVERLWICWEAVACVFQHSVHSSVIAAALLFTLMSLDWEHVLQDSKCTDRIDLEWCKQLLVTALSLATSVIIRHFKKKNLLSFGVLVFLSELIRMLVRGSGTCGAAHTVASGHSLPLLPGRIPELLLLILFILRHCLVLLYWIYLFLKAYYCHLLVQPCPSSA